jgi:hypothetical protein
MLNSAVSMAFIQNVWHKSDILLYHMHFYGMKENY